MTVIRPEARGASLPERKAVGMARWLSLCASPTFAAMAAASILGGMDHAEVVCSAAEQGSLLSGGMAAMYVLMAVFHFPPWMKLSWSRKNN
jgi:hypothetical protein